MTNDKPRDVINLHGQDKEVSLAQLASLKQSNTAAPPARVATPGRKPLFRR